MIKEVFMKNKDRKYIIQGLIFFGLFLMIYFILDYLNMSYKEMSIQFGTYLVVLNITLNIVMSFLGAFLMNLSTIMVELRSGKGKGSNLGFFSMLFGILTYGCTSCVIAFFGAIGINFIVIALPMAGLPYKLISLGLLILGFVLVLREVKVGQCKVKFD